MINIIIMGSSGDLAFKKIYPALNKINQDIDIILYCNFESENKLKNTINNNENIFFNIKNRIKIVSGDYKNLKNLSKYIKNSIFYLSLPPFLYLNVLKEIIKYGGGIVAIEKPFGENYKDFLKIYELIKDNKTIKCVFIDHFITKFLPIESIKLLKIQPYISLLNSKFVKSCHIIIKENITANKRKYFDSSGTVKDMLVNHLIQYFIIYSGEDNIINNLLKNTRILYKYSLFGQYEGYKEEMENINTNTETFALVVLKVETNKWKNTPFLLYSGKSMEKKDYKIIFKFKKNLIPEICKIIKYKENIKKIKLVFEILEERIYFDFGNKKLEIFNRSHISEKKKFYDYEGIFYALINNISDFPFVDLNSISSFWNIFENVFIDPKNLLIYKNGHNFKPEILKIEKELKKSKEFN